MPKRKHSEGKHENTERWLLTYSDMITLLLALFILLFAMSSVDAEKYKALKDYLGAALNGKPVMSGDNIPGSASVGDGSSGGETSSKSSSDNGNSNVDMTGFDKVYQLIKGDIAKMGMQDHIEVERGGDYILLRFKDNVLFYGDQSIMLDQGKETLKVISHTLSTINPLIDKIQIEGHTADNGESTKNLFDWTLSANRAIEVLRYMVQRDELPQSKMSIAGFSHYKPIATNSNEQGMSRNRRVEIRITQVQNQTTKADTSSSGTSANANSSNASSSSKASSSTKSSSKASSKK